MTGRDVESSMMADERVPARARLGQIADGLAVATAISLPWSTSATGILIVLWLTALVPTLDPPSLRRELVSAAGGLPVLLWASGALGLLWADVSWSERIAGLSGFHKLLLIPLLLAQFRRSGQASRVILGFFASCVVLLVLSWISSFMPAMSILQLGRPPGVPVKDYIFQSAIFAVCACGAIGQAAELWHTRARLALMLLLIAAAFIGNILYVATARTTLIVMALLLLLFGVRKFGWRGALLACLAGGAMTGIAWMSSPYLRERVLLTVEQMQTVGSSDAVTSVGLRLEYWRKSLAFVAEAPLIGHGTGAIPSLFRRDKTAETSPMLLTSNPHNQILTVAIQLGLVGSVALVAMWIAHLALFRDCTLIAWFGLIIAVQNLVGSLFNSYLFDFSQGWLYVIGLGVVGGTALGKMPAPISAEERT